MANKEKAYKKLFQRIPGRNAQLLRTTITGSLSGN